VTHPDPMALVLYVCEPGARAAETVARHLIQCPSCADEVRRLGLVRGALGAAEMGAEGGPECPEDDLLAALAAGELQVGSRSDLMVHLSSCRSCRATVASLSTALADPAVAAAKTAADRPWGRRLTRLAVPAAAAVLLIAVLGRQGDDARPSAKDVHLSEPSPHRAPVTQVFSDPVPLSPRGVGDRPVWLRWTAVAQADLYRVTLYQSDGQTLYQRELRDTATAVPDSIRLIPGSSYFWRVEARTGWDRWVASEWEQFTIAPGASSR
jgi:hypothetical protein